MPPRRHGTAGSRRPSGSTSDRSQLLEQCVDTLHLAGFQIYSGLPQFLSASNVPSRYVIKNYPHPTLYGGKGRKEAFIRADGTDYILEAKWQQSPGSVDEKIPYIWESFLESEVKNWFVVMDGRYWRDGRGKAVFAWLNQKAAATGGQRQMVVTDRRGFIEWAKCRWI